ncbi:MAG: hypothetical protein BAJALOKI1v1_2710003 [Promethearchaeota archaeon]|nr:MAG: hypothetical protein BAJALOKI1v1_2710003 [Candidatus Lokiarchaeota archaeon]
MELYMNSYKWGIHYASRPNLACIYSGIDYYNKDIPPIVQNLLFYDKLCI